MIFGLPRSGTTWLGKIFDSHPRTLYRHEPDNYPRLESLPRFPSPAEAEAHLEFLHDFVAELPRRNDVTVAAKLPIFRKAWRNPLQHRLLQAAVLAAKLGGKAGLELPVLGARGDGIDPSPTVVWKSIESLGRFGLLMRAYPAARGIHLMRHPCGQISSVLRGERQGAFRDNSPTSEFYDLFVKLLETPQARRRGLTIETLRHMRPVERLAWTWVLENEKAVEETEQSERVRVVRYEDLCADPVGVSREVLSFAGLGWNVQTEGFVAQSTHSDVSAYYSVYKNPVAAASRWHNELPAESIERILAILKSSPLAKFYSDDEESGHDYPQSAKIGESEC
ncbi:MAG TPA: sulfotransferase [Gammaproteobacteria bacterium]|nr:sulfotransferase [Gammaproteobacteria bacterium]